MNPIVATVTIRVNVPGIRLTRGRHAIFLRVNENEAGETSWRRAIERISERVATVIAQPNYAIRDNRRRGGTEWWSLESPISCFLDVAKNGCCRTYTVTLIKSEFDNGVAVEENGAQAYMAAVPQEEANERWGPENNPLVEQLINELMTGWNDEMILEVGREVARLSTHECWNSIRMTMPMMSILLISIMQITEAERSSNN